MSHGFQKCLMAMGETRIPINQICDNSANYLSVKHYKSFNVKLTAIIHKVHSYFCAMASIFYDDAIFFASCVYYCLKRIV